MRQCCPLPALVLNSIYSTLLGVTVTKTSRSERRLQSMGLSVRDLIIDEDLIDDQHYATTGTLATPCIVAIEHPRYLDYELIDTPPPISVDDHLMCWRVGTPTPGRTGLTICQRC